MSINKTLQRYVDRIKNIFIDTFPQSYGELGEVMRQCHRKQTITLAKAHEALECGNYERSEMWRIEYQKALESYVKEYLRPMLLITGDNFYSTQIDKIENGTFLL